MIEKHDHPTIHELVLEAGLGKLVFICLHVLMSFSVVKPYTKVHRPRHIEDIA
jgi:hypothetical protein